MKALKQRFHQEIVRKYKSNYFATVRKEILELNQFQSLYNKILDSNQDLNTLIQKMGYIVFYKHINQFLDEKLYQKLYQNEQYFLQNLSFVNYLLESQVLPIQQISMLIQGLSQVTEIDNKKISVQNIKQTFQIVQKILQSDKYFKASLKSIKQKSIILNLYRQMISREMNDYFFKIISFCKIIGDEQITHIGSKQQLHCLQLHILTSQRVQEIYVSYSLLGNMFQKIYTPEEQLFEYGSILDKMMKDIVIDRLIDPISYFFMKALNNHSINKLVLQMNFIEVIFNVILNTFFKKNSVSVFGQQSIWCIFKKIISTLIRNKTFQSVQGLNWVKLSEKLQDYHSVKYPYVKIQIYESLTQLSKTNLNYLFAHLIPLYKPEVFDIQI